MARMTMLALLVVAGVLAVAQAGEVPTLEACEITASSMDANDFVAAALGGSAGCMDAGEKTSCCDQILGLFGEGGAAEFCMCNADFFSAMLMGLPGNNDVDPTSYVDLLEECGVPVAGESTCPEADGEEAVEPKVQGQIVKTLLLKKVLAAGAVGALLKRRPGPSPPPKSVKASTTSPTPSPTPAPTPTPAVAPAAGKKAPKVHTVVVAPAPKAVVAPAPKAVVVAEPAVVEKPAPAPVVVPAPVPAPVAPKVTAPAIVAPAPIAPKAPAAPIVAPKVTAGRK